MDPNACLARIADLSARAAALPFDGDDLGMDLMDEAHDAAVDLGDWLSRGGFPPVPATREEEEALRWTLAILEERALLADRPLSLPVRALIHAVTVGADDPTREAFLTWVSRYGAPRGVEYAWHAFALEIDGVCHTRGCPVCAALTTACAAGCPACAEEDTPPGI